jgi:PAS domain S-box-containing protein
MEMGHDEDMKVFLIEDNPGDAQLIQELLKESKIRQCDWEHTDKLSSALERLAKGGIDVILLDLSLPDSHGIDTFKRIYEQSPNVPIVVMTGLDDDAVALKAVSEGAQDYLIKGHVEGDSLGRVLQYSIERKRAEETIRENEERYRTLAEAAHDSIFIVDRNGIFQYINHFAAKNFNLLPADIIGKSTFEVFPKEVAEQNMREFNQVFNTRVPFESERELEFNGEKRWMSYKLTPIISESGEIKTILGIARDITDRKQAEEKIKSNEKRLSEAQQIAHVGNYEWGIKTDSLYWSDEFYRIFGVTPHNFESNYENF